MNDAWKTRRKKLCRWWWINRKTNQITRQPASHFLPHPSPRAGTLNSILYCVFTVKYLEVWSLVYQRLPMDYRGPGFLAVVWFGFSSTPSHPLPFSPVSKLSLFLSLPVWGRGWTSSKITPSINHSILSDLNHARNFYHLTGDIYVL